MAEGEAAPKLAIRRAGAGDAALIASINADVQALHAEALPWRFKPPGASEFSPAAAAALIAKPENVMLVAEAAPEGGAAVAAGYVYAELQRRPETPFTYAYEQLHIHHIGVRPEFRDQGVGEALLEAVRRAAAERKIELITLDVWSFNESARSFFRRNGFNIYNERLWNRSM